MVSSIVNNNLLQKKIFGKNTLRRYVKNMYNTHSNDLPKEKILEELIFSRVDLELQNSFTLNKQSKEEINRIDDNLANMVISSIRAKLFTNSGLNFYLTKNIVNNNEITYNNLKVDAYTVSDNDLKTHQLLTIKAQNTRGVFFDVQGLLCLNIETQQLSYCIDAISKIFSDASVLSDLHAIHLFLEPVFNGTKTCVAMIHFGSSNINIMKKIVDIIKTSVTSGYLDSYPIGTIPVDNGFSYREMFTVDVNDGTGQVDPATLYENIKYCFNDLYKLIGGIRSDLNDDKLPSITHDGIMLFINDKLDRKRLLFGYSTVYYGLISNLYSDLRSGSTIFDALWDGFQEPNGHADIHNLIQNPNDFLEKNIVYGDGEYWRVFPRQNYMKIVKTGSNNYQVLYSNDKNDSNSIQSYFMSTSNNVDFDPFVQYRDIPKNPGNDTPHILVVGFVTTESIIVTQHDANTYRIYKDGRSNSGVIYDNQLIVLDQNDYNPSSEMLIGAMVFLIYVDGVWKLYVQRNQFTINSSNGAPTFGQIAFDSSFKGAKVMVLNPSLQYNPSTTLHDTLVARMNHNISGLRSRLSELEKIINIKIDAVEGHTIDNLTVPVKGTRQYKYLYYLQEQKLRKGIDFDKPPVNSDDDESQKSSFVPIEPAEPGNLTSDTINNKIMVGTANFIGDWQSLLRDLLTKMNIKITELLGEGGLQNISFADRATVSKLYLMSIDINRLYQYHNALTLFKLKNKYGLGSVVKDFNDIISKFKQEDTETIESII